VFTYSWQHWSSRFALVWMIFILKQNTLTPLEHIRIYFTGPGASNWSNPLPEFILSQVANVWGQETRKPKLLPLDHILNQFTSQIISLEYTLILSTLLFLSSAFHEVSPAKFCSRFLSSLLCYRFQNLKTEFDCVRHDIVYIASHDNAQGSESRIAQHAAPATLIISHPPFSPQDFT
jgi:hypothetical protein